MARLFIFNNASRAAHYGIGTYVRQLVEGWTACPGVEVSLVDMSSDVEEYTIADDAQGIRHYQIPSQASNMESEGHCRRAFYFLARHIAAGSGERLVFHFNYFQHFPLAVLLKGQYFDSRILLAVHYLGWCFALKGNKTELRRIMAKDYRPADDTESQIRNGVELEKRFLHFADEVIALSRDTQEFLATDYGVVADKVHLVYNGMGGDLCRERVAASPASRVVLFVGRLDEIKGLDFLIDAFRRLAGKHPDIRLVVAGDGDFQRYLSRSRDLQGRVSFLGRMEGEELEEVYRSAYTA